MSLLLTRGIAVITAIGGCMEKIHLQITSKVIKKDLEDRINQLNDEQLAHAKSKGLTQKQYALRESFKEIFDQLVDLQNLYNQGDRIFTSGYSLKSNLKRYPDIAEKAVTCWTIKYGIYDEFLALDLVAELNSDKSMEFYNKLNYLLRNID